MTAVTRLVLGTVVRKKGGGCLSFLARTPPSLPIGPKDKQTPTRQNQRRQTRTVLKMTDSIGALFRTEGHAGKEAGHAHSTKSRVQDGGYVQHAKPVQRRHGLPSLRPDAVRHRHRPLGLAAPRDEHDRLPLPLQGRGMALQLRGDGHTMPRKPASRPDQHQGAL